MSGVLEADGGETAFGIGERVAVTGSCLWCSRFSKVNTSAANSTELPSITKLAFPGSPSACSAPAPTKTAKQQAARKNPTPSRFLTLVLVIKRPIKNPRAVGANPSANLSERCAFAETARRATIKATTHRAM